jgi:hypothetical protein
MSQSKYTDAQLREMAQVVIEADVTGDPRAQTFYKAVAAVMGTDAFIVKAFCFELAFGLRP